MKAQSFFLVYSPHGVTPPTVEHPTHKLAFAECYRLAKLNPGADFYVMRSASRPITRTIAAQLEAAE